MDIYKDIEARCGGDIYMGVVGPVRTGKSTFIKSFMELMVLPAIDDENSRRRANDELPQSAGGRTIMTTEPKFIPKDAVDITVGDGIKLRCRLIDCVGYMVEGAEGHEEDGVERLVKTPWYDHDIPFTKAAEIGTKKVIFEHSTVGIVVTCDGTITDLPRSSYIEAEKRTVNELKELGKPFILILNSKLPAAQETKELAKELAAEYGIDVVPVNCDQMKMKDINKIFECLLMDFPVTSVNFNIPKWVEAVGLDNPVKAYMIESASAYFRNIKHMRDVYKLACNGDEYIQSVELSNLNMADGSVNITMRLFDKYYYEMLSDTLGTEIRSEYDFIREITALAKTKNQCEKVSEAYAQSCTTGYGSVSPDEADIVLDAPELIRSGNKYGVKIKAKAPSIHLIKANITTEIAPIVGSEEQARELIEYINSDDADPDNIWSVNIFGKSVRQLVEDGLRSKINKINQESQQKLQDTMEKIVNDSNGGMVCIII